MSGTFWAFPGQGSQTPGMGRRLAERSTAAADLLDRATSASGFDLRRLMWDSTADVLVKTENAQPAVVAFSLAALAAWRSEEVRAEPVWVAGHSVGSLAAAAAAGSLDPVAAIGLARRRGEIMSTAPGSGGMLAVAVTSDISRQAVARLAEDLDLDIACVNGARQVVLAGALEAIVLAGRHLGARSLQLTVSHAFHSRLMAPVVPAWSRELESADFRDPIVPCLSSRTGELLTTGAAIRHDIEHGIRETVRWDLVTDVAADCDAGAVFGSGASLMRMWRGTVFGAWVELVDDDFRMAAHV